MSTLFKKPNREIDRIFIHCTASENASYNTVVDGIFGSATARAVREFKKEHNLYASDIVHYD